MHRFSAEGMEQTEQFYPLTYIKYSLDFLRPITTAEAFEAVDWLADLPQQTWLNFVEVNSRNLDSGHVCWGSYDGFNLSG